MRDEQGMMRGFAAGLGRNLLAAYQGRRWLLHLAAFAATALIVLGGLDWGLYLATRHPAWGALVAVAGLGGFIFPIIFPVIAYLRAKSRDDVQVMRIAVLFAQASLAAWVLIAAYKTLTGRMQPDVTGLATVTDISRGFQFGFFRNGIFWGWPSHHTGVAFAGATVLYLGSRNTWSRIAPMLWAIVVGAGAAVGFHWLSDVVAGVFVGVAVGHGVWVRGQKA